MWGIYTIERYYVLLCNFVEKDDEPSIIISWYSERQSLNCIFVMTIDLIKTFCLNEIMTWLTPRYGFVSWLFWLTDLWVLQVVCVIYKELWWVRLLMLFYELNLANMVNIWECNAIENIDFLDQKLQTKSTWILVCIWENRSSDMLMSSTARKWVLIFKESFCCNEVFKMFTLYAWYQVWEKKEKEIQFCSNGCELVKSWYN